MLEAAEELPVREGYAAWASSYDDDGNPLTALEEPAMWDWFGPIEGRRVLDLGCGTGRHACALAAAGARVWGLDLTPEMLARARMKPGGGAVRWVRHALPAPLPFRPGTFHLVVLGLVAEHVRDLGRVFRETARVLTPGGRLVVSALHPERTAEGQRARFIDPDTGLRRPITTYHRTAADYRALGDSAGLSLEGERTLVVSSELAEQLPRAARYEGKALGWVACWSRPDRRSKNPHS